MKTNYINVFRLFVWRGSLLILMRKNQLQGLRGGPENRDFFGPMIYQRAKGVLFEPKKVHW
jgi:hypothetical protein